MSTEHSQAAELQVTADEPILNATGLPDMFTPPATPPTPLEKPADETVSDVTAVDDIDMLTPVNESQSDLGGFPETQGTLDLGPSSDDKVISGTPPATYADLTDDNHSMQDTVNPAEIMKAPPVPPRPTESTKKRSFELFAEQNDVTEAISKVMDQLRWAIKADDHAEDGEQVDSISR